jgi:hypothetical protein
MPCFLQEKRRNTVSQDSEENVLPVLNSLQSGQNDADYNRKSITYFFALERY